MRSGCNFFATAFIIFNIIFEFFLKYAMYYADKQKEILYNSVKRGMQNVGIHCIGNEFKTNTKKAW